MVIALSVASCIDRNEIDVDVHTNVRTEATDGEIHAMAAGFNPLTDSKVVTKSLVDRITTRELNCQFLRMDEIIDSEGEGTYTFSFPDAMLVQAKSISSPDNTDWNLRGVTFNPAQTYKIRIKSTEDPEHPGDFIRDTTHFYHTRMVGWYPRNLDLFPEPTDNNVVYDYLDNHPDLYTELPDGRVAIHFENLTADDDVMVSDLKEGQQWHSSNPTWSPGAANDNGHYSVPFGHNNTRPKYLNYFKFKHYRSAIRVYARMENSDNAPTMWGKILGVTIADQPTACDIVLPDQVTPANSFNENEDPAPFFSGGNPGDVVWSKPKNFDIVTTPMFGKNDSNSDPELMKEVDFDNLDFSDDATGEALNIYLGYSMIQPEHDVTIEINTTSGIYRITVPHEFHDGKNVENIFLPSYYYTVVINFTTEGTVAEILQKESEEYYYDMTARSVLKEEDSESDAITGYAFSNCYILDANPSTNKRLSAALDSLNLELGLTGSSKIQQFDGYAFCAIRAGNDKAGILDSRFVPNDVSLVPNSARLVWESADDGIPGLIRDVVLKHNYVRFRADNGRKGNAVIAVYDDQDRLLWSWHIWVTDTPNDVTVGGYTFLDRNLGATSTNEYSNYRASYGLYYQWGRKDPSMGPPSDDYNITSMISWPYYDYSFDKYESAEVKFIPTPTLADARKYPQYLLLPSAPVAGYDYNWMSDDYTILWGYDAATGKSHKSLYDPCPYGYKVPADELQKAITAAASTRNRSFSHGVSYGGNADRTKNLYLPYAGFKGEDRASNTVNLAWTDVGKAGDYQTAIVTENTANDENSHSYRHHRGRVLVYNATSKEYKIGSMTNHYNGQYADYNWTNRRTAASVRCVKENNGYGTIEATFTYTSKLGNDKLMPNDVITLNYSIDSYSSVITSLDIDLEYKTSEGISVKSSILSKNSGLSVSANGSIKFNVQDDNYLAGVSPNGYTFRLTVVNSDKSRKEMTIVLANGSFTSSMTQIRNINTVPTGVTASKNNSDAITWVGTKYDLTFTATASKSTTVSSVDIKDGANVLATINGSNGTSISNDDSGAKRIITMSTGNNQGKLPAFPTGGIMTLTVVYHTNRGDIESDIHLKVWDHLVKSLGAPLTAASFDDSVTYVIIYKGNGSDERYLRGTRTTSWGYTTYSFPATPISSNRFDKDNPSNEYLFTINGGAKATFKNINNGRFIYGDSNITANRSGMQYDVRYVGNKGFSITHVGNNEYYYYTLTISNNNLSSTSVQTSQSLGDYWEIIPYYQDAWVAPENL